MAVKEAMRSVESEGAEDRTMDWKTGWGGGGRQVWSRESVCVGGGGCARGRQAGGFRPGLQCCRSRQLGHAA